MQDEHHKDAGCIICCARWNNKNAYYALYEDHQKNRYYAVQDEHDKNAYYAVLDEHNKNT